MSDSISNFITIIRNAYRANKESCTGKYSKMHWAISQILKEEGYIRDVQEVTNSKGQKSIKLILKYVDETPALTDIQRESKSGCRLYFGYDDIPRVLGGLGVGILTTSKGVIKDRDARKMKVGGEMVCSVW